MAKEFLLRAKFHIANAPADWSRIFPSYSLAVAIKYDPALQGPPFGHAAVEIWPPALHSPPSEGNSKELE